MVELKDTPVEDVKGIIDAVAAKKDEWKNVSLPEKVALLKQIRESAIESIDEWLAAGAEARGVSVTEPTHGQARGELYMVGPGMFGNCLNLIITSLESIIATGKPPAAKATRVVKGKAVVTVFPDGLRQSIEASGMKGDLYLADSEAEQDSFDSIHTGGVVGVLGAGNFDAPTELLGEMFLKGRVGVYKPNPVNQNTHPVIAKIFAPLVSAGYLAFIVGAVPVGSAMVEHPLLDEIVLTGSAITYDKIVWGGSSEEQKQNKTRHSPKITTPVCAELGSVNPWIIVPGEWSDKMIDSHAAHLAASKTLNNGHICASPQVLIVAKDWPQRQQFLDRVRYWLRQVAPSPPFYPGSGRSHQDFSQLPNAEVLADGKYANTFKDQQAPVLIPDVADPDSQAAATLMQREAFCPVLSEFPLDVSPDKPIDFLRAAIDFADKKVWGSLTCSFMIQDSIWKAHEQELEEIVADMPFGSVGINIWGGFVATMSQLRWGGYPGHTPEDVQSGIGYIGNSNLWKNPQKAVLRAPFNHQARTKVLEPGHFEKQFRRLSEYMSTPGFWTLTKLLSAALLNV
eukprot:TRINITY_DN753_c0_g1_i1.p1 TRINITY_DN753_c0_g1~~TRINITY_DN753_c0_g1_i1.p1  ORF type:complete len:568 (+),score=175.19 TRINITY_DN753_c0_g1_i1:38-1741(+)